MKRNLSILLAVACLGAAFAGAQAGDARQPPPVPPARFFGIAPQSGLTPEDVSYMKAGGIESIRWPLIWAEVQPTKNGGYNWTNFDQAVGVAARGGLQILPSITSPPRWVAAKETSMPIDSSRQKLAWKAFLKAAAERYGPGGEYWTEHAQEQRVVEPEGVTYEPAITPPVPIRTWQIWNESNFFYFAYPVSPSRYAKLVTISSQAIKSVQPSAQILLSGLFGTPTAGGKRGMPAATFLRQFYRYPGIKSRFDAISLHPYAVDSETLEELVEEFHEVPLENHDRPGFYITEMGWGSQNNFKHDAFEQGPAGQTRQLRASYRYLMANQRRLNLRGVYWFSWKDIKSETCDFCDSVGLFHEGKRFRPKPAWRTFVRLAGGRARP